MGELWEFQKGNVAYLAIYRLYSHVLTIACIFLILPLLAGSVWD